MVVPQVADEFIELVGKSGLLPREKLDAAVWKYGLREKETPIDVARKLVAEGLLTRYQAERLLNGKQRGLILGNHKLLYILGSGGMGVIYAAEELDTGFKVAIKVLSQKYRKDPSMFARFQLEAQAGMRLAHPNILRTFDIQRTEDVYGEIHYVVMEFVKGLSLPELLLLNRPLPWKQACDIIRQAAVGLDYAHRSGMVHRDVKPENLLIRSDGAVKLVDFGLAMVDENDEEFSMAMIQGQDRSLGTADYVAPEQVINSYQVDARADIYSLGCTFYAALTARVPFPVQTVAQKLECHRRKKPPALERLRPDVPEQVRAVIAKMMAKHPKNRFSSAAEVARILEPLAERKPVEFDFRRVLAFRAKQAERRTTAYGSQQSSRVEQGQSTSGSSASRRSAPTKSSNRETNVGKDTRVDDPKL